MNEESPPIEPDSQPEAVFEIVDDKPKNLKKPYAIMSIVCLALASALLTISLKQKTNQTPDPSAEVAGLKIELDDLHNKVRAKRISMGLEPSIKKNQSAENMALDAQQSIQQLVEHSKSLQAQLDEKDINLLHKEQQIDDLTKELTRLKGILQRLQLDP